jgi:hypothetical protein
MRPLELGFLKDFKGADSVLLAASSAGVASLVQRLRAFVGSSDEQLPLHEIAWVAPKHSAELFFVRSTAAAVDAKRKRFNVLCSSATFNDLSAKLLTLANSRSGHQYFDLMDSPAQLVVSVGEYDETIWQTDG